jgi:hypothetical protein
MGELFRRGEGIIQKVKMRKRILPRTVKQLRYRELVQQQGQRQRFDARWV